MNCIDSPANTEYESRIRVGEALERSGRFARVVGFKLRFAVVTEHSGEQAEYAWPTLYRMAGYSKCPACGYWAFNGEECFDCGYRG